MKTRLCGAALSTTALLMAAAPAYAFPTRTDVGDSFTRSGTSSLGTNWAASNIPGATGTVALGSQRLQFPAGSWSSAHWSAAQFGGLQEARVQKTSPGQVGVTACLTNPGPSVSGYALTTEGTGALTLKRYTNGVATTLFSNDSSGGVVATNNVVGIAVTSTGVEAWIGNGTWVRAKAVTDSAAASCSGRIGVIGLGASGDNFAGGGLPFGSTPTPTPAPTPTPTPTPIPGGFTAVPPQASNQFVSSIGVNAHFRVGPDESGRPPYCSDTDFNRALVLLKDLGVDDVREEVKDWDSTNAPGDTPAGPCETRKHYNQLVDAGFGINLVAHVLPDALTTVDQGMLKLDDSSSAKDILDLAADIKNRADSSKPGAGLIAVEATNELDGKPGAVTQLKPFREPEFFSSYDYPWRQKLSLLMPRFMTATKARLPGTDVVFASLARGGPRTYAPTNSYKAYAEGIGKANALGTFDRNNIHFYSDRTPPETYLDPIWLKDSQDISSTTPLDVTEVGWNTGNVASSANPQGVTRQAAAIYTTRAMLALATKPYVGRQYLYELADMGTSDTTTQHRWGLLDNQLNPKPSYFAVKGLLGALANGDVDKVPAPTLPALNMKVGQPTPVRYHLFAKGSGFVLALWRPESVWANGVDVDVAPMQIPVEFDRAFTSRTFRPARSGADGAVTWTAGSPSGSKLFSVPVGADPILVELTPSA